MGKEMINDATEKADKRVREMEEECEKKVAEIRQETKKFRGQQEEYEARAKSKLSTYKHKLHITIGKQNQLMSENSDLQAKYKKLEREKKTLQEENDRFRRQIGTRLGGDSDVQKQFEKLQREFNLLLDENRKMKEQIECSEADQSICSFNPDAYIFGGVGDGSMTPYKGGNNGRGNVSNATVDQIRSEYDDTIQKLKDEKRELIMRNSAAMTDVQKAELRAWEREEELSRTKSQLTSMTLALQRAEMRNGDIAGMFDGMGESIGAVERSTVSRNQAMFSPDVSVIAPEARLTTPPRRKYNSSSLRIDTNGDKNNRVGGERGDKENAVKSNRIKLTPRSTGKPSAPLTPSNRVISSGTPRSGMPHAKTPRTRASPSLMEYTRVRPDGPVEEGDQGCQQS